MVYIERTLDVGLCLDVLTNKEIFDSISEDGANFNNLKVDVIKDYWLAILTDNDVIGCIQFKPKYKKCFEGHIHILPEFRKEHSINSGKAIIGWIESSLSGCVVCVEVPEFCNNVISFLNTFEFKESGIIENAYCKNGKQNDLILMSRSF